MKADELPQRIKTETARHNRIALKMTFEKPKVRVDIEFRLDLAFAKFARIVRNQRNSISHQHRRSRELAVFRAKQIATSGGKELAQELEKKGYSWLEEAPAPEASA